VFVISEFLSCHDFFWLIVVCTSFLYGKLFSQSSCIAIPMINHEGYPSNDRTVAIDLTLSLTVLMYLSISGKCLFISQIFMYKPLTMIYFCICLYIPYSSMLCLLQILVSGVLISLSQCTS
jgi:hypothetical protein